MLERAVRRMESYLRGPGLLVVDDAPDEQATAHDALFASAVSGQTPPAGPQWVRGLSSPVPSALGYDKPLCASLDGSRCTRRHALAAATWRDAKRHFRYVLRPPLAQERLGP